MNFAHLHKLVNDPVFKTTLHTTYFGGVAFSGHGIVSIISGVLTIISLSETVQHISEHKKGPVK